MTIVLTSGDLSWIVPSAITIIGAGLKTARQQHRIEEGVGGLYPRVAALESKRRWWKRCP